MTMMTVTAFAARLGINRRTAHRWARTGRVRAVKTPGGHWRIDSRDLEKTTLSTAEFAREAGICQRTVLRWIASGKLDATASPGGFRIAAGEVEKYGTKGV